MKLKIILSNLFISTLLISCGGGDITETESNQTINQNQTEQTDNGPYQRAVYSSMMFQSTKIKVKVGDKITIKSTGLVTVGLFNVQNNGTPQQLVSALYADANGANGWSYNPGTGQFTAPNPSATMNFNCGFQAGTSMVKNMRNDGVIETIASPIQSLGPCCSDTKRAVYNTGIWTASTDLVNGQARNFVERNACAADAPHGALIMKIVPEGQSETLSPVIRVQKLYETNPYTVQTDGEIYLGVNDLFYRADNDGSFAVTISRL